MAGFLDDDPVAGFLQQEEDQLREIGIEDQFSIPPSNSNSKYMDDFSIDSVQNETQNYTPVYLSSVPIEEPASLVKWREEKAASLRKQEEEEAIAIQAWKEKSKKDLEDWYNRYAEQLAKVTNENKVAEEHFIAEMTDTQPGNEWVKTARLCDFNPKFSKNTKDVSRMRGLLLQLKQSPLAR